MLNKEQNDPRRSAEQMDRAWGREPGPETEREYNARLLESPADTLERVIGGEVVETLKRSLKVWLVDGQQPTRDNIDFETDYPNLHM